MMVLALLPIFLVNVYFAMVGPFPWANGIMAAALFGHALVAVTSKVLAMKVFTGLLISCCSAVAVIAAASGALVLASLATLGVLLLIVEAVRRSREERAPRRVHNHLYQKQVEEAERHRAGYLAYLEAERRQREHTEWKIQRRQAQGDEPTKNLSRLMVEGNGAAA